MKIYIYDRISGQTAQVDQALRYTEGNLQGFTRQLVPGQPLADL
jgi:hypothetical protein